VETLTGNSGGAVGPDAGHNINVVGTGSITVVGNPGTNTLTITPSGAIATTYTENTGTATPAANNLNILGARTAAGTTPVTTTGAGSTVTVDVQTSQAIAATNATNIGLAAFNSTEFTVDANGFVSLVGGNLPALQSLSDDVSVKTFPDGTGNIQLVGHVVEQGATKFSTIVAGTNLLNVNPMSASRWIVDALGFNGTHTTIQAAITAATSGDDIVIVSGTYTENLTLKAGVNITGQRGNSVTPTVTIIGNATYSGTGNATLTNVRLQTNGSFFATVSGANASVLHLIDCDFQCTNSTGISFTSSNAAAQILCEVCTGNIQTTGITYHSMSSVGTLTYRYCQFSNVGASVTQATNSAGIVNTFYCSFTFPFACSGAGIIQKNYSFIDCSLLNVTAFTITGTGTSVARYGDVLSGTATAITIGTGARLNALTHTINSTNAAVISGAGTLKYGSMDYVNTAAITVTSQIPCTHSNDAVVVTVPGSYPYTTNPQDGVILVDTSAARTIIPLAAPKLGQMHRIKDNVGSASTNAITITPSGALIDGLASRTIISNWGSIDIVFNGVDWRIL
jgi:hypothetical protein